MNEFERDSWFLLFKNLRKRYVKETWSSPLAKDIILHELENYHIQNVTDEMISDLIELLSI
jgi:hypothetical protein